MTTMVTVVTIGVRFLAIKLRRVGMLRDIDLMALERPRRPVSKDEKRQHSHDEVMRQANRLIPKVRTDNRLFH